MAKPKTEKPAKTKEAKKPRKPGAKKDALPPRAPEPLASAPWAIDALLAPIEQTLASAAKRLARAGERTQLGPPVSRQVVEAVEAKVGALPDDVRALLTLHDGLTLADRTFLSTRDHLGDTDLARRAREFLAVSAEHGKGGIEHCIPIASWGQPNDWLLFDPLGGVRGGEPGLVVVLTADAQPIDGVVGALQQIEKILG